MSKKKTFLLSLAILIVTFFAANLVYPQLLGLKFLPDIPFKLGLDLQGGTHLVYEADFTNVLTDDPEILMQGLKDIIEKRVNLSGVSEPLIQIEKSADHYRLIVELAGITDPNEAIKEIGKTPYLEFKEESEEGERELILEKIKEVEGKSLEELQEITDWQLALEDPYFQATPLTGQYLKKATLDFAGTISKPLINLEFNEEGARIFEELTEKNINKILAIYIDDEQVSIPIVQDKISGGKAQISGNFTVEEAKSLANNLSYGALPVPINLISQQTVGPTLGIISLEKSLKAGLIGLLAIVLFMIAFYRLPGLIASLSLTIYVILLLFIFKLSSVTLTLAGIGGFILSMGMAVDANVLIFARLKEELAEGKSYSLALEDGFNRAWSSVRDGNLTTLLVAGILYFLGTSFVKGFALTLSLGILVSIFSAVFVTRSFLGCFIESRLEKIKWLWS